MDKKYDAGWSKAMGRIRKKALKRRGLNEDGDPISCACARAGKIQRVFLKTLEILSNINPVVKPYVKSWFTTEILDTMLEIYEACRNFLPLTTQRALHSVTTITTENTITSTSSEIPEINRIDTILQILVDFLYDPTYQPQPRSSAS